MHIIFSLQDIPARPKLLKGMEQQSQASPSLNHSGFNYAEKYCVCSVSDKNISTFGDIQKQQNVENVENPAACTVCNKPFVQSTFFKQD